jgi:hypothetical protein
MQFKGFQEDYNFMKLRAICKPINSIYEISNLEGKIEYEFFKSILPLFEGL